MIVQHFHAPVGQVAGRDVINEPAAADWAQWRATHRDELCGRRDWHQRERDAACHRLTHNPLAWWARIGGLGCLFGIGTGWLPQLGLTATCAALALGLGLPLLLAEPFKEQWQAQWNAHNQAMHDIDRALNVL